MIDLAERARPIVSAASGWIVALAAAVTGVVWLVSAAVGALSTLIPPAGAQALVGVLALLPLGWLALRERERVRKEREAKAAAATMPAADPMAALGLLMGPFNDLLRARPLAAMALATLCGLLVARFPQALGLLARVLNDWPANGPPPTGR